MVIRILVAEDNLLVREGLVRLIEAQPELDLVATTGDLDGLLAEADACEPDVVLTDIRMPPSGTDEGIRAAAQLRRTHPEMGVIVLTQFAAPVYALALLEHGSEGRGYLLKERVFKPDQLLAAVGTVAGGGSVIDPQVVDLLFAAKRPARSPLASLTPREAQVLAEIAKGKTNAAIAGDLVITERAVEKHVNSIFAKLDLSEDRVVHRRVQAVLLFLTNVQR